MCSMLAGNTSETHLSAPDDDDDDDDDVGSQFTVDFNVPAINHRQDRQTKLIAATLNLKKKLTRSDNGRIYTPCLEKNGTAL